MWLSPPYHLFLNIYINLFYSYPQHLFLYKISKTLFISFSCG
nr:MAG TPA: hypothetical protein [Caudoviricetes sp.]